MFTLTKRQGEICRMNPEAMKAAITGIQNAVSECKAQFADEKWNCTGQNGIGNAPLKIASKESAYVYALMSAGVSHALARACAKGLIPDCGCGDLPNGNYELQRLGELESIQMNGNHLTNPNPPEFIWAGCSDNVKYGNAFGRRFLDSVEKENVDERSLMNLHNNRVGRKLLTQTVRKQCKCHGVSGSCLTKTCWKTVPSFDDFAKTLKNKYQQAKQVTVKPQSKDLMVRIDEYETVNAPRAERFLENKAVEPRMRRATKNDLVFFEESPDYCVPDSNREILGSKGRECRDRAHCEKLCCNRGWDTRRESKEVPCNCKFIWCCEVKCDTCISVVDRHFCR
uniref:Protein Wnt n=1 Tax=Panagrolaimus sp. JU765 TaxID=591449 RepID=A0AC34Q212_9BILA